MRGVFITFEGPEGGGKTSQIAALARFLRQQGLAVVTTREPGGTAIGDQIRAVLMDQANWAMHPRTEILLFLASRAQLVEQVLKPALAAGQVVLCDRYADSTLAYQGYGRGEDLTRLRELLAYATDGLWPDLTLLLDLPVEEGLLRRAAEGSWNRLDADALEFHRRVRQGYHRLAAADPQRWRVIDARAPFEVVQAAIQREVVALLRQRHLWPATA